MGDITFPADIMKRFNDSFPDIKEADRDRYGFATPGDILAENISDPEKAVKIRNYLTHAELLDLDNNPATKDVSVYRDASTTTLSIRVGNSFRSVFSINFANPNACFITYPEDHYNLPIPQAQCRLVRAAHPSIEGLKASHLVSRNWIREDDKKVLIPLQDIQKTNTELIRLSNAAKVGTQMDTPSMVFDIFNLPSPLSLKTFYGTKIDIPQYPFVRDNGERDIRPLSSEEISNLLTTTAIPGKSQVSADKKTVSLVLDEDASNHPIAIKFGWIINRTDVRGLPTDKQFLNYATDDDHIQWTAINSEQPVAIIGDTTDAAGTKWLHILTYKVKGWVKAKDVAMLSKAKALQMWTNPNVVTVTNTSTVLNGHFLEMGTRLQIVAESKDFISVAIAKQSSKNGYDKNVVNIAKADISDDVELGQFYKGRVPFSRENVVKLLFRYLGTPWAMANERRGDETTFPNQGGNRVMTIDCSGIIEKAMDAMGLYAVSRTSKWQVRQGNVVWEKKTGSPTAEDVLGQLKEDIWLIGMPGHIMFYLGERDNVHWMLHSPGHFRKYADNPGDFVRNGDGQAVVSPISLSNLHQKFDVLMSPLSNK